MQSILYPIKVTPKFSKSNRSFPWNRSNFRKPTMQEQKTDLTSSSIPSNTFNVSESERGLRDKKVKDILVNKRRLVEVPYTASLAHTMNALVANEVVAVPVAAPPGHWIGAGGSMIVESDKQTGAVRKHYIGMVTMLDVLAHLAGDDQTNGGGDDATGLEKKMSVPVSSIIGQCLESLSLWTLNPNTSIVDCMEVFSKGIHRALVPLGSDMENVTAAVELVESASSYRMLTQMDVLKFLKEHTIELQAVVSRSVGEVGAVNENVYAISGSTTVMDAIRCMRAALLNAVPIVAASDSQEDGSKQLINGRSKKLIGTFSATDLRGCHFSTLQTWFPLSALEFTDKVSTSSLFQDPSIPSTMSKELITCFRESPVGEVIDKAIVKHVHRVWVVDEQGLLVGLVSLTDIIKVIRDFLLSVQT